MKALLMTGYGSLPDHVRLTDIPAPVLREQDVLIDVHAVSINPIDVQVVQGALRWIEKRHLPIIMGFDVSGTVRATGRGVRRFHVGDSVFARSSREHLGTFAEQVALDEQWVASKPASCSHAEAASIPLVGLTTVQALIDRAQAKPGQRILIHAGSGGVGTFAIQYAKILHLHVTTTTSSKNAEFVRQLGADEVICYDKEDYLQRGAVFDIVYDTLGDRYTREAFQVVKLGGVVVSIAGVPDKHFPQQVHASLFLRVMMGLMSRRVFKLAEETQASYHRFLTESNGLQLADIAMQMETGHLRPVIDQVFAFEHISEAMTSLAAGHTRGKIVVQVKKETDV